MDFRACYNPSISTDFVGSEMVTPQQRDDIASQIKGGLGDLITGTPGLFQDRPGFIQGGGPTDPFSNVVRELTQLNCRIWASSDKSGFSARVNQGNAALCNPYLGDIGESAPDGGIAQPFQGGQCPVNYFASGTYDLIDPDTGQVAVANQEFTSLGPVAGPISGFVNDVVDGDYRMVVAGAGGSVVQIVRSPTFRAQGLTLVLARQDGLADDCGSPEGEYEPPGTSNPGTPPPGNITVNIPGIGPIDVRIDLDGEGDPVFCIDAIGTCIEIEVGGDEPGGGGGGEPVVPGDQGEPGPTGDAVGGAEADGEAPEGSVLVGLKLDLLNTPPDRYRLADGLYRGGAYIYMGGDVALDQDFAGSILRSGQFVYAERSNLTRWAVRANVGFEWRITPYYKEVE